ncbi:hypothetical protein WK00_29095 [Burkholderia ubonensis]|nr:hypothetical protein WK00_29095 [Burkholderia ubonensis]
MTRRLTRRTSPFGFSIRFVVGRLRIRDPENTRLLYFWPFPDRKGPGESTGSFDYLGSTHYWATSKRGGWVLKHKTANCFTKALQRVSEWC